MMNSSQCLCWRQYYTCQAVRRALASRPASACAQYASDNTFRESKQSIGRIHSVELYQWQLSRLAWPISFKYAMETGNANRQVTSSWKTAPVRIHSYWPDSCSDCIPLRRVQPLGYGGGRHTQSTQFCDVNKGLGASMDAKQI
jgi:hypothetical protein